MKKKQLKCKWCTAFGDKDEMKCEENIGNEGKVKRRYFHIECYNLYLEDREFKEEEWTQWTELYEFIKTLHNLELLDTRMIKKLQDLRNGNVFTGKKSVKKYKEGVKYNIILEAYRMVKDSILYWIKNKEFDTKFGEFSYCYTIMESKINDIVNEQRRLEYQKKMTEQNKNMVEQPVGTEYVFKKKESVLDISAFLD